MAKNKTKITLEKSEENEKTVYGLVQAEALQKDGWQLIDCHLTPEGKVYKFKKGN